MATLKAAIPNAFVADFEAAPACCPGPLGFHALFVSGDSPLYAHGARDAPWAMPSLSFSDLDGNLICFATDLMR